MKKEQEDGVDAISSVLRSLREMERRAQLEDKLAVGELLLQRFFDGKPHLWREKQRKSPSIRRLAARKGCPLRKSALHAAIAVYVAVLAMPWIRDCEHIKASHVKVTLTLPPQQQARLLRQAEQAQWSVRRLAKEVVTHRSEGGERRGRPAFGASKRAIAVLRPLLARMKALVPTLQLDFFDSPEQKELCQLAQEVMAEMESLSMLMKTDRAHHSKAAVSTRVDMNLLSATFELPARADRRQVSQ